MTIRAYPTTEWGVDVYGATPLIERLDVHNAIERLDLHNAEVDELTALSNLCGYQDLRTGRVCRLPARHPGSCRFVPKPLPGEDWLDVLKAV